MGAASAAMAFSASELVGPYADAERQAESELQQEGLTEQMDAAKAAFNAHRRNLTLERPENPGRQQITDTQLQTARQIYDRMTGRLNPEQKFLSALDVNKGFKIGSYHFQPSIPGTPFPTVHFEWNIISNPVFHGLFDVRMP
jgi:hypothetical protein